MMSDDDSIREIRMITLDELSQGTNLLRCPRILSLSRRIQPAFVADRNRMSVMPHTVGTHLSEMSANLHAAVTTHHIVVPDPLPVDAVSHSLLVPVINLRRRACLVRTYRRTMNDNH